jgi:hypothetical protein
LPGQNRSNERKYDAKYRQVPLYPGKYRFIFPAFAKATARQARLRWARTCFGTGIALSQAQPAFAALRRGKSNHFAKALALTLPACCRNMTRYYGFQVE